jgi:uncharacterized protein YraI
MTTLARMGFVGALGAGLWAAMAFAHPVTSPATVYAGPGPKWGVIAQIPAGADVQVLNCYGGWQQGWCKVRYGAVKGYVEGDDLAPAGASSVVIAPVVTTYQAALRKGPGANWPIVKLLAPGETVNVSQCIGGWSGGWCRVSASDSTGWVRGGALNRKGAIFD